MHFLTLYCQWATKWSSYSQIGQKCSFWPYIVSGPPNGPLYRLTCENRPLKKVLFDTTGFLEAQNLTQEQRDSRQNLYDNRSKEQCFEAICEHITAV